MAILPYGPLDGFYKRLGNLVGKRAKGKFVLSGRPKLNNALRTPEQQSAQSKFALLNKFLQSIDTFVIPGFKKKAKKIHPVKAAYHYNYPHAFMETGDGLELNYSRILYSKGDLLKPCCPTAVLEADKSGIMFSWLSRPESLYSQDADLASFLIYDSKNEIVYKSVNSAGRAELGYSVKINFRPDAQLECYMHFTNTDGKLRSDSQHVAQLINLE